MNCTNDFLFQYVTSNGNFLFCIDGDITTVWILADGTWNDLGIWDDTETWND